MLDFPNSPLAWTQFLVSQLLAGAVTSGMRTAVDEFTEIEPDGTVVKATTFVGGQLAAASVQSQTDSATEKIWNWVGAKKAERAQKKNAKKDEK